MDRPIEPPHLQDRQGSSTPVRLLGIFPLKADWLVIIVCSLAAIASGAYLVTDGFHRASELSEAQRWESHTLQVMVTAEQSRSAIRNMQRGERGYLLTSDHLYLQPYFEGRRQAEARLDQLKLLTRDNLEQAAPLHHLALTVAALEKALEIQITDQRENRSLSAISLFRTGKGENLIRAADSDIEHIMRVETRLLDQRRRSLRRADAAAWQNRLALSALGLAAIFCVLWLLLRSRGARRVIEFERERASLAEQLVSRDAQLAEQVEELNALYASAPIGLAFFSRDYRYLRVNEELALMDGRLIAEHIGQAAREIVPESASLINEAVDQVFQSGRAISGIELKAASPFDPDNPRHWLAGFYPVRNERGQVEAVGAWMLDISERKKAEDREALLAREVDHRAKNLLAVVQSVVQLTHAGSPEALKEAIMGRIQALARAHSLLAESRWDGAQLDQLVREELAPYLSGTNARATVTGAPLMLRPAAAQSLGIVLHELATNAVKYGALSTETGRLDVQWQRSGDGLEILWSERDGPSVRPPRSSGFGSKIIRASIERQLHGSLEQDWRSEGLQCTIRISAREALGAGESQPA